MRPKRSRISATTLRTVVSSVRSPKTGITVGVVLLRDGLRHRIQRIRLTEGARRGRAGPVDDDLSRPDSPGARQ